MKIVKMTLAAVALSAGFTGAVSAHSDATNPVVIERMKAMEAIGGGMKTLADMAKGKAAFDAAAANAAIATFIAQGEKVPALFEENVTEDASEALPAIWENWDDYVAKSEDLVVAAKGVAEITDTASLGAALGQVGGTCKACHRTYRE